MKIEFSESGASLVVGIMFSALAVLNRVATVQYVLEFGLPYLGIDGVSLGWWQSWGALVVLTVLRGSVGDDNDKGDTTVLQDGIREAVRAAVGLLLVWVIL